MDLATLLVLLKFATPNMTLSGRFPPNIWWSALLNRFGFSNLSEFDVRRLNITEAERQESLLDLEWEISCYCNMLYFMVQIFKGDDEFGDELSKSNGIHFTSNVHHLKISK